MISEIFIFKLNAKISPTKVMDFEVQFQFLPILLSNMKNVQIKEIMYGLEYELLK